MYWISCSEYFGTKLAKKPAFYLAGFVKGPRGVGDLFSLLFSLRALDLSLKRGSAEALSL